MEKKIQIIKQPWFAPQITDIKVKMTDMPLNKVSFFTDSYAVAGEDPLIGVLAGDFILPYHSIS